MNDPGRRARTRTRAGQSHGEFGTISAMMALGPAAETTRSPLRAVSCSVARSAAREALDILGLFGLGNLICISGSVVGVRSVRGLVVCPGGVFGAVFGSCLGVAVALDGILCLCSVLCGGGGAR